MTFDSRLHTHAAHERGPGQHTEKRRSSDPNDPDDHCRYENEHKSY